MNTCFEEVRLSLPHIELAAHLYGPEDGAPVLALHGWLDNAASFARLAPRLAGLRIVALDFAGHGHSEHRPAGAGYALWDYAYDVLQVAEQFGCGKAYLFFCAAKGEYVLGRCGSRCGKKRAEKGDGHAQGNCHCTDCRSNLCNCTAG